MQSYLSLLVPLRMTHHILNVMYSFTITFHSFEIKSKRWLKINDWFKKKVSLLHDMVDILSSSGWLAPAFAAIDVCQMVIQGVPAQSHAFPESRYWIFLAWTMMIENEFWIFLN